VIDTDGVLTAGEIRLTGASHTLVSLQTGAGPAAEMEFVLLNVASGTLSAADFTL
jgi:ribonucleotide monophosphatase NagD (HAD superfamily)